MREVRMSDIAFRLGVSTVTVSKALSDKEGVGEELKETIKKTAAEMGYQKRRGLSVGNKRNYTIGILLTERLRTPDHSFYWTLCMSLIEMLKNKDYSNMLEIVRPEQENGLLLPDFVGRGIVDGIIILGAMRNEYLAAFRKTGLPIVLADYYDVGLKITSIIPDSFIGACEVTLELLDKGHRRIGFLGSIKRNNNAHDRYYGYLKALNQRGIEPNADWVVENRDAAGVLKKEFDLPADMPTAFFCDTDQSAYYFLQSLQRKGYKVPEDVSIAGFYDHVFATLASPKLTTYHIGIDKMASAAVLVLLKLISKKEEVPERVTISGRVVSRESVANLNDPDSTGKKE